MQRKRTSELNGLTPQGDTSRVPFDQTDPMEQVAAPSGGDPSLYQDASAAADASAVAPGGGGMGGLAALGQPEQPPQGGGLAAMMGSGGAPPQDPTTDGMSDQSLAGLDQGQLPEGIMSPEDQQIEQMSQALDDPQFSPDQKQMIQQQLDIAARRKMAGLGGLGG